MAEVDDPKWRFPRLMEEVGPYGVALIAEIHAQPEPDPKVEKPVLFYITESEKMAWDLYYGFQVQNNVTESAAVLADKMILERRKRYMPRNDGK